MPFITIRPLPRPPAARSLRPAGVGRIGAGQEFQPDQEAMIQGPVADRRKTLGDGADGLFLGGA